MAITRDPIKAGVGNGAIGPAGNGGEKAKTAAPGTPATPPGTPGTPATPPAKAAFGKTAAGDKSFCDFRVKLGDKIYSLAEGQILTGHYKPYVRNCTKRYSETRFLILDPDATEYSSISEEDEVRVEIGYPESDPECKFVGKIKDKGRLEPNATIIYAIDNMAQLASSSGAGATSAADTPLDLAKKVDDTSKYKVASTTSAKLVLIDRKAGEKTAQGSLYNADVVSLAHSDMKIGTNVRITNVLSKKVVTTKVADKTAKVAGYAASKALFKELGMPEISPTDCKFEVLIEPPKQPNQRADAAKASPDNGVPAAQKEIGAASKDLKYAQNTSYTADKPGTAKLQQTAAKALSVDAAQRGDSVIGSGNTVKEISADQAQQVSTGLILNYTTQRDYFAAEPIFMKRTALRSPFKAGTLPIKN
jgi:rare lipoprotein A (peptidoglycan hydrolase)